MKYPLFGRMIALVRIKGATRQRGLELRLRDLGKIWVSGFGPWEQFQTVQNVTERSSLLYSSHLVDDYPSTHQRPGAPHEPQGAPHRAPRLPGARLPAPRHACLRHACLRHACLRDACYATIVSSHVVSLAATAQPACLRDALRLRSPAAPRTCHPAPPCDPVRLCAHAFSAPK